MSALSTVATLPEPVRRIRSAVASRVRQLPWMPGNWLPSLQAACILWRDYAHLKSVRSHAALDAAGNPLPWYTYPAIEFLSQLDFRDAGVFEYGSGMSTLFWARMARQVVSVEDDETWFENVSSRVPKNADMTLETDLGEFPHVIHRTGLTFDVIVVDGPARGRTRYKCCRQALTRLNPGGLVVLDNSDWLPESSQLLRESGLLEVDMTGFAPICGHVQTTSFYFHRQFNRPPLHGRQPLAGAGSRPDLWERPLVPTPGELIWCDGEPFRGVQHDVTFRLNLDGRSRSFRVLSYLGGDDTRNIAILGLDRDRVLLTRHTPAGGRSGSADFDAEIARLAAMTPDQFVHFIRGHEYRRYLLK